MTEIVLLLASPIHRYEGRPDDGAQPFDGDELPDSIEIAAGLGVVGDRYFGHRAHRQESVTIIAAESFDRLGEGLDASRSRRNIVTRGIELNTLVGQRFRIGDVECVGRRLCEPCAHLERLTHKGVLRKLIHRGGLRADILTTGNITVGATIERLEPDQLNPRK